LRFAVERVVMRVFVAVFPPLEVQAAVAGAIDGLRRPGDGVSWVKRENLHYTLRFLGEIGDDGLRRVGEAASEAGVTRAAFAARLGGFGAFPAGERACVLWIGMGAGARALVELASALSEALEHRGFAPEGRPFAPHLTIGRVRTPGRDWGAALSAAPFESPEFRIERITVVESTLSPGGSRYTARSEGWLEP
jgi:2'-5' RNA ligase